MRRRTFVTRIAATGALAFAGKFPLEAMGGPDFERLTILHTNDVHSRIDPFPMDGSSRQGLGGVAKRAALIDKIRSEEENVLLLDAGDIFQGTPYFNVFGGELEIKLMSEMQYDAGTIGNHDFDGGMEGLVKQLTHATFPLICSNYDFRNTPLNGQTIPRKIFQKGDLKIGVLGVGIALRGLVPTTLYGETQYLDPISHAQEQASILRNDEGCDYVICLSHLGFKYSDGEVSDIDLGNGTTDIDLIIGGHTHTFLDQPEIVENLAGNPVYINQVGWAGMRLGRIDLSFERNRKRRCVTCENLWVRS